MKIESKRKKEIEIIEDMINLYCKKNHKTKKGLCKECQELKEYAILRINKCPFMENKTFCSNCKVHCYKPDMREKVKKVMRYSGPRIIFKHPIKVIKHLIESKKEKKACQLKK